MTFETTPPTLADFFNDMNQHGGSNYRKIGDFVAELERRPSGDFALTLWRAVTEDDHYAPPDGKEGNRYAWDAVGRTYYDTYDEGRVAQNNLVASEQNIAEFMEEHPYDGPLSPYSERVA